MNYWLKQIKERPYNKEVDLFRMIKYGTIDLVELFERDDFNPEIEFTKEEYNLVTKYMWSKNYTHGCN